MEKNLNKNEMLMKRLVRKTCDYIVGGYENQMMDSPKDSESYKEAYDYLYETPIKVLISEFYDFVMDSCRREYEEARFAGKEFTMVHISAYCIREKLGKEMAEYRN